MGLLQHNFKYGRWISLFNQGLRIQLIVSRD